MDPVVMISIALLLDKRKRKKKKFWTKQWFQQKQNFGHVMLLNELRINHPEDYRNFLRMDEESFDELMDMLTPLIQKKDTRMRQSITPLERLSVTLRYLATGNTFEDLKFLCAISPQTIGRIVVETCSSSRLFGIKNFFQFFSKIGSKSI